MSSRSRYPDDDRRRSSSSSSRRDGYSSGRRESRDSRRSSPGPSRGRSPAPPPRPRDENELPVEFGRPMEPTSKEDENTVLRRMKTAFTHSPLVEVYKSIIEKRKIKIWTRNFKEVRGICTGFVQAFDKHWNLILGDVEEVYLKPKKAKTPFLLEDKEAEDYLELPPRVPRVKKTKAPEEEEEAAKKKVEEVEVKEEPEEQEQGEGEAPKKEKPKKKKKGRKVNKRHLKQLFVRGDNIVMCAILEKDPDEEQEQQEED